jgi:hypothetical protein
LRKVCTGPMQFTPYRPWTQERKDAARARALARIALTARPLKEPRPAAPKPSLASRITAAVKGFFSRKALPAPPPVLALPPPAVEVRPPPEPKRRASNKTRAKWRGLKFYVPNGEPVRGTWNILGDNIRTHCWCGAEAVRSQSEKFTCEECGIEQRCLIFNEMVLGM